MIELDWTLYVQIINFLVLVFLLNLFLFRPIRRHLKERQDRLAAFEGDISALSDQSQGLTGEIQDKLAEARRQGVSEREGLKQDGAKSEASLLEQVKKQVEEEWATVEQKIKADMAKARKSLHAQAQSFAQLLAAKILGRELS
jgi:F-type H+-transporting ATPase subunit b